MRRLGCSWIFALLVLLRGTALGAQDPPIELRAEATVRGETIRLSDLLSFDATSAARLAAAKISLGMAPEPGSVRVFSAEELRHAVAGGMAVKFPALAVVRGVGWPLRDSSIRLALQESEAGRHYDFSRAALIPPADFATRSSDPRLEILAIRAEPDLRKLTASMRCQRRADCGSFLVEVVFGEPMLTAGERPLSHPDEVARFRGPNPAFSDVAKIALVQPGRLASLLFEGEGFKITTRVFPLQRAGMGQMVRVFDPAARHVSLAQVEGRDRVSFREAR